MLRLVVFGAVLVLLAACDGAPGGTGRALQFVGESRVTVESYGLRVEGRVKNTGTRPVTGTIKVTLLDADGKIVGTCSGAVNGVQPGEEATYSAIGTDKPAAWATVEPRIDVEVPA